MFSAWLKVFVFILLIGNIFPSVAYTQASVEPFKIELIVPVSNPQGQREIALDRYPRLHLVLSNTSNQVQKIWKTWNTWGYFNITLEWTAGNQTHRIYRKAPKAWDGDFPDYWIIRPGEKLILEIDMSSGEWEGFPDLYGESISAMLKASYQNKSDDLASDFGIWVGKLTTPAIPVVFK